MSQSQFSIKYRRCRDMFLYLCDCGEKGQRQSIERIWVREKVQRFHFHPRYRTLVFLAEERSQPRKLLESLVCKKLDFFLERDRRSNSQWGFRKGISTELLQFDMTEKLRFALNQKKSVGVVFMDFQKDFDCASHQLLPIKLQASGLCLYERLQPDVRARIIGCKT